MARERYLLHAGEDTIHNPEAEKEALQKDKTPRGKWENFWYYHKFHVLIAVFVLLVAGYSIWSTVKTVQPDYTIGMITQQSYPQEAIDALQNGMAKYGKDLNKDGRVVVQIDQYTISSDGASSAPERNPQSGGTQIQDPQFEIANQTKLAADLSQGTSMIFLTDDASFLAQEKNGERPFAYLDGSTPKGSAADYDKMRISIQKCPKLANLNVNLRLESGSETLSMSNVMKDMGLSLRVYYGSGIQGKEKDYYAASKDLFQKLTS